MQPCRCMGLENVTWRCNWNCVHCYFRRFPQLHKNIQQTLVGMQGEINAGKTRGCTSMVLCGKGEPMLHTQVVDIIKYTSSIGMKSLMITNGSAGIDKYRRVYDAGLDHLQISMHGLGDTLDAISEREGAGKKQMELLEWLHKGDRSFRINITMQKLNKDVIFNTVKRAVELGAFHVSLLTFLPHYDWHAHMGDVAVHPVNLVTPIMKSLDYMEGKALATLRYFPMCLLEPRHWKYVTNAAYVLFDPWEWEYGRLSTDIGSMHGAAIESGIRQGIKGQPCDSCVLQLHCGGWNEVYARAFNLGGLRVIKTVPDDLREVVTHRGGLFDLNPANQGKKYV